MPTLSMFGSPERLMRIDYLWKKSAAGVIGTGLIALDVVLNERRRVEPRLWTGGTCGNVMAILAYLGWPAYPVARVKSDSASRLIRRDLKRWRVDTRYMSLRPTTPTPIIIHQLRRTSRGENFHSFSRNCPDCGTRLPAFRPIPIASLDAAGPWPVADVFFADRVSPGILTLAEKCALSGALVVFEPSGIGDESLFERMLRVAHVVKYSNNRIDDIPTTPLNCSYLEVQTLGNGGLRYRSGLAGLSPKQWIHCEAYSVQSPVDTAGAGDWCTGGILHLLGRGGLKAFKRMTAARLQTAITFGQALASWNCGFEGARGGMYEQNQVQFRESVKKILRTRAHVVIEPAADASDTVPAIAGVCSDCRRDGRRAILSRLHSAS